ncbi:hypothetical protein [Nonomuraea lactucae]|nr:hypothetical protein [Nonomuraea lactucae]
MIGADKWRNPNDDLPDDFETRRAEYYEKLNTRLRPGDMWGQVGLFGPGC